MKVIIKHPNVPVDETEVEVDAYSDLLEAARSFLEKQLNDAHTRNFSLSVCETEANVNSPQEFENIMYTDDTVRLWLRRAKLDDKLEYRQMVDTKPHPAMINAMKSDLNAFTAICELLDNAIQATEGNGEKRRLITVKADPMARTISIVDNGCGVPYNKLQDVLRVGLSLNRRRRLDQDENGTQANTGTGDSVEEIYYIDTDISRYGFGLKAAVYCLSNTATIQTKTADSNLVGTLYMDLHDMQQREDWHQEVSSRVAERKLAQEYGESFTVLEITKVHQSFWDVYQDGDAFRRRLAEKYYFLLNPADFSPHPSKRASTDYVSIMFDGHNLAGCDTFVRRIMESLPAGESCRMFLHVTLNATDNRNGKSTDLHSLAQLITYYFPAVNCRETTPVPVGEDQNAPITDRRPGMHVFWQGRLLDRLEFDAQHVPAFMELTAATLEKSKIPVRCLHRVRAFLFLDGQFEPTSHKTQLSESDPLFLELRSVLNAKGAGRNAKTLRINYANFLKRGHELDDESTPLGKGTITEQGHGRIIASYPGLRHGGHEFKRGSDVELSLGTNDKAFGRICSIFMDGTPQENYRNAEQRDIFITAKLYRHKLLNNEQFFTISAIKGPANPTKLKNFIRKEEMTAPYQVELAGESAETWTSDKFTMAQFPKSVTFAILDRNRATTAIPQDMWYKGDPTYDPTADTVTVSIIHEVDGRSVFHHATAKVTPFIGNGEPGNRRVLLPPCPGYGKIRLLIQIKSHAYDIRAYESIHTIVRDFHGLKAAWCTGRQIESAAIAGTLPPVKIYLTDAFDAPMDLPPNIPEQLSFRVALTIPGASNLDAFRVRGKIAQDHTGFIVTGVELPAVKLSDQRGCKIDFEPINLRVKAKYKSCSLNFQLRCGPPVAMNHRPTEIERLMDTENHSTLKDINLRFLDEKGNVVKSSDDAKYTVEASYPGGRVIAPVDPFSGKVVLKFSQPVESDLFDGRPWPTAYRLPTAELNPDPVLSWIGPAHARNNNDNEVTYGGFSRQNIPFYKGDTVYVKRSSAVPDSPPDLGIIQGLFHTKGKHMSRAEASILFFWQAHDLDDPDELECPQEVLLEAGGTIERRTLGKLIGHAPPVLRGDVYKKYQEIFAPKRSVRYCHREIRDGDGKISPIPEGAAYAQGLEANAGLKINVLLDGQSVHLHRFAMNVVPDMRPRHIAVYNSGTLVSAAAPLASPAGSVLDGLRAELLTEAHLPLKRPPRNLLTHVSWAQAEEEATTMATDADHKIILPPIKVPNNIGRTLQSIKMVSNSDTSLSLRRDFVVDVIAGEPHQIALKRTGSSALNDGPLKMGTRYASIFRMVVKDAYGNDVPNSGDAESIYYKGVRPSISVVNDTCELVDGHVNRNGLINLELRGLVRDDLYIRISHPDLQPALEKIPVTTGDYDHMSMKNPKSDLRVGAFEDFPRTEIELRDQGQNKVIDSFKVHVTFEAPSQRRTPQIAINNGTPAPYIELEISNGSLIFSPAQARVQVHPPYGGRGFNLEDFTGFFVFSLPQEPDSREPRKELLRMKCDILPPDLITSLAWGSCNDDLRRSPGAAVQAYNQIQLPSVLFHSSGKPIVPKVDEIVAELRQVTDDGEPIPNAQVQTVTLKLPEGDTAERNLPTIPAPVTPGRYQLRLRYRILPGSTDIAEVTTSDQDALWFTVTAAQPTALVIDNLEDPEVDLNDPEYEGLRVSAEGPTLCPSLRIRGVDSHDNETILPAGQSIQAVLRCPSARPRFRNLVLKEVEIGDGKEPEFPPLVVPEDLFDSLTKTIMAHLSFKMTSSKGRIIESKRILTEIVIGDGDNSAKREELLRKKIEQQESRIESKQNDISQMEGELEAFRAQAVTACNASKHPLTGQLEEMDVFDELGLDALVTQMNEEVRSAGDAIKSYEAQDTDACFGEDEQTRPEGCWGSLSNLIWVDTRATGWDADETQNLVKLISHIITDGLASRFGYTGNNHVYIFPDTEGTAADDDSGDGSSIRVPLSSLDFLPKGEIGSNSLRINNMAAFRGLPPELKDLESVDAVAPVNVVQLRPDHEMLRSTILHFLLGLSIVFKKKADLLEYRERLHQHIVESRNGLVASQVRLYYLENGGGQVHLIPGIGQGECEMPPIGDGKIQLSSTEPSSWAKLCATQTARDDHKEIADALGEWQDKQNELRENRDVVVQQLTAAQERLAEARRQLASFESQHSEMDVEGEPVESGEGSTKRSAEAMSGGPEKRQRT